MRCQFIENTLKKKHLLINSNCMNLITKAEFVSRLNALDYQIDPFKSFDYSNVSDPLLNYDARSIAIIVRDTNLSFAHKDANKDNLEALQQLRRWNFCFQNGRIWNF